jgi:hypothetical protein
MSTETLAYKIEPGQIVLDRAGRPHRISARMTFPATGASEFYVGGLCVLTVWPHQNGGLVVVEEAA